MESKYDTENRQAIKELHENYSLLVRDIAKKLENKHKDHPRYEIYMSKLNSALHLFAQAMTLITSAELIEHFENMTLDEIKGYFEDE